MSIKSLSMLAGAVAVAGALSFNASAKELKIASFLPTPHHVNKVVIGNFITAVEKETNGSLKIKNFTGGALGKGPVQQYKRVVEGIADISFGVQAYTSKIFQKTLITGRPGLGETAEEVTKRLWNIYEKHLASEYGNVKVLSIFVNWPAALITKSKEVKSLADVKGMKIRVTSPSDDPQIKAWGAVPVHMGVTSVYNAMNNGVIDAVYIAPSTLYRPWNFSEPAKYVTVGMTGPTNVFFLLMNKDSWNGLSKAEQAAIDKHSGRDFSVAAAKSWSAFDIKALATAKTGKGVELIQLTPAQAKQFDDASNAAVKEDLAALDKSGINASEIYNDMKK